MRIFCPDTNFFLQCEHPSQIDWKLVTDNDEIVLLVVREVRKELDRLKSGGNQRRSKRARSASANLRRFTSEGVNEIELRAAGPRVVLRIAPRAPEDAYPPGYRIESSDERIVAEVYVAGINASEQLAFLSHDTVPLEDANGLGMHTQVIPEEWLLDLEASDIERELADVKRRMKAIEGRAPDIDVVIPLSDGRVVVSTRYFEPLSDAFVSTVMREIRKQHPPGPSENAKTNAIHAAFQMQQSGDEKRWERYIEDHTNWLAKVEDQLHDTPRFLNDDPCATNLTVSIANKGSVGADNLIVRISARGAFHLVDPDNLDEDDEPKEYFPSPPKRPRGMVIDGLADLGLLRSGRAPNLSPHLLMPQAPTPRFTRDRHAIYWEYESDFRSTYIEGQCEDFRHGLNPVELILYVGRTETNEQPVQGAIEVLVSAGNLTETLRQTCPISIEVENVNAEQWVRDVLKRELGVDI